MRLHTLEQSICVGNILKQEPKHTQYKHVTTFEYIIKLNAFLHFQQMSFNLELLHIHANVVKPT